MDTTTPLQESLFRIKSVAPEVADEVTVLADKDNLPKSTASLVEKKGGTSNLSPMLRHYLEVKATYQERVVFYQVGDFFEVFFDDAVRVSDCLSIRLTSRDKDQENPIPMCGVPIHAFKGYANKLIASGIGCVVVEQIEDASQAKGLVKRDVTRVLTPGVIFESEVEDQSYTNYILSLVSTAGGVFSCSIMEASTGALYFYQTSNLDDIASIVVRYQVREVVIPNDTQGLRANIEQLLQGLLKYTLCISEHDVSESVIESLNSKVVIQKDKLDELNAISKSTSDELKLSMYLLLGYVLFVSRSEKILISSITRLHDGHSMILDGATIKNLEILQAFDGSREYSLVGVIDKTRTALGSRQLKEWILSPSIDSSVINDRLDKVESLVQNQELLKGLRQDLYAVRDLERICTKLISGRISPYDIGLLHKSLLSIPEIEKKINEHASTALRSFSNVLKGIPQLTEVLDVALQENLPIRLGDAPVFKATYNSELGRLRELELNSKNIVTKIEVEEKQKTGISTLRIKYNSVLGYFIEVSANQASKVPAEYIKKQTLSNVERYYTPELKSLEKEIFSASAKIESIERELFSEIKEICLSYVTDIQKIGEAIGIIDGLCSFAFIAIENQFVRPFVDNQLVSEIEKGRHPVVEKLIGRAQFVPNNLLLKADSNYFSVLTGPNMGGKSTYLKQAGIIHIMAQAGSFVPAAKAHIGIVDQIFTRIGAGDNLSRGESTFMVEMKEASHIIASATNKSLVLVDELGRGTATADGYALALAIAEWLIHEIGSRTIFATHFHELNSLEHVFSQVNCLSVGIIETAHRIEFTHLIEHRAAEKSYGIHVAKLAGMPEKVLKRAREIADSEIMQSSGLDVQPLKTEFSTQRERAVVTEVPESQESKKLKEFIEILAEKDPDALTPKNALEVVYDMVEQARRLKSI